MTMPKPLHHYIRFFVPFSKDLLASFVEIFGGFKPLVLFNPRSRELLSSWNSLSKGNNNYPLLKCLSNLKSKIPLYENSVNTFQTNREKKNFVLVKLHLTRWKQTSPSSSATKYLQITFSFHQVIVFLWVLWYSLHIAAYVEVSVALLCLWMHSLGPQMCIFQCQWKVSCGNTRMKLRMNNYH